MTKKTILTIAVILTLTLLIACSAQTTTKSLEEQVKTQSEGENKEIFESRPSPSEVACPHGRVYEDYAGCGLYKDSDGSGYCDHSE